jgi:hypothetical protein
MWPPVGGSLSWEGQATSDKLALSRGRGEKDRSGKEKNELFFHNQWQVQNFFTQKQMKAGVKVLSCL